LYRGLPFLNVSAPRVLHLPEVGVVRDIPRALKIVAAVLLMIVTVPLHGGALLGSPVVTFDEMTWMMKNG